MYSDPAFTEYWDKRFYGIYRGVVIDTNDPEGQNRIRMQVPQILGQAITNWSWPIIGVPVHKKVPYGAFQDDLTQTAPSSTTAYPMLLRVTDSANYVSVVENSKVTFTYAGVYNIQWSGQFQNTDTSEHDIQVWIRKNGVDVTGSTGFISVPNKHGGINGHTIVGWNYVLELEANDYIQFMWQSDSSQVTLEAYAGGTTPTTPTTASVILTASLIGGYTPEPGEGCWVMFEGGDPNFPLWLGAF